MIRFTSSRRRQCVTANNYVRAETDVQMKGYIESYMCFGKFSHFRKYYEEQRVTVRATRTRCTHLAWDTEDGDTIDELSFSGPMLGVTYRF